MHGANRLFAAIALIVVVAGVAACATARSDPSSDDYRWTQQRRDS